MIVHTQLVFHTAIFISTFGHLAVPALVAGNVWCLVRLATALDERDIFCRELFK